MRLLKEAHADLQARDVRGDRQHRRAGAMSVVQALDQMCISRPAAARTYCQPPGQLRLGGRGERARLFVANVDPLDPISPAGRRPPTGSGCRRPRRRYVRRRPPTGLLTTDLRAFVLLIWFSFVEVAQACPPGSDSPYRRGTIRHHSFGLIATGSQTESRHMASPRTSSSEGQGAPDSMMDGLVDEMLGYYIDWRHDAAAAEDAYRLWSIASTDEEALDMRHMWQRLIKRSPVRSGTPSSSGRSSVPCNAMRRYRTPSNGRPEIGQ